MGRAELSEVERWERNLANGSAVYASVSARRLRAFLRDMDVTAEALVTMDPKRLRNLIEDYLAEEKKKGHAGGYVRTTLKALRSWLVHNEREFPKGIKVPNDRLHPRIEAENTPTTDDLRRVLLASNSYERVAISLIAFSGLRLQCLGSHLGDDGVTVADLPEMKIEKERVSFEKVPTLIRIRATNSKNGSGFQSYLGPEGCRYVAENLQERIRGGEKIGPSTAIVTPSKNVGRTFMTTINIGDRIRKPMRACDVSARPYSWRSYFIQKCLEAQSARGVPDRFVEFWVGHSGDVSDRHYGTGKANLSPALIEEMRGAYAKCCEFLETTLGEKRPDITRELKTALLEIAHVDEKERAKLANASNDEVLAVVRERLIGKRAEGVAPVRTTTPAPNGRAAQRPVPLAEAEKLMAQGFRYVAAFGPDRVILEPPN